jgi:hypothetical protein
MKVLGLILLLILPADGVAAAEAPPSARSLFSVGLRLPEIPVAPLYAEPVKNAFELSAEAQSKKMEADMRRFKSLNGREVLDLTPPPAPPTGLVRLFNLILPGNGAVFGRNPNAPPGGFTR